MRRHSSKHTGMYLLLGVGAIAAYLFYSEKNASAATPGLSGGGSSAPALPSAPAVVTPPGVSINGNGQFPITATVTTQTDPLNIRSGPSLGATVVGTSGGPGTTLFIEGAPVAGDGTQAGGWAPVLASDGTTGYASMVYLHAGA